MTNLKERLRPSFDRMVRLEYTASTYIAKGKEKSRLGFLPDAVVAGGFAASIIQSTWQPILISLAARIALTPLFISIGWLWKKSGAWDREADFVAKLTPLFRRLDKKGIRRLDRRRNRNANKSVDKI